MEMSERVAVILKNSHYSKVTLISSTASVCSPTKKFGRQYLSPDGGQVSLLEQIVLQYFTLNSY